MSSRLDELRRLYESSASDVLVQRLKSFLAQKLDRRDFGEFTISSAGHAYNARIDAYDLGIAAEAKKVLDAAGFETWFVGPGTQRESLWVKGYK